MRRFILAALAFLAAAQTCDAQMLQTIVNAKTCVPIALVNHVQIPGAANGGTSAAINTSGANFLILAASGYDANNKALTPTDNKGNTWVPLTAQDDASLASYSRLWYVKNPVTGSGHTVTYTGTASNATAQFAAFANVDPVSPYDQEIGNVVDGGLTLSTGTMTPTADGYLVLTAASSASAAGIAVDSGFTISDASPFVTGVAFAGALAYKIQPVNAPLNPIWTFVSTGGGSVTMASFKSACSTGTLPRIPPTGANKTLGGHIVQIPATLTGPWGTAPNTNLQYAWMQQNWATVYPNWIYPQMVRWKQAGANTIAFIAGMDAVMSGSISYATWQANLTQMLNDCRALGLKFHYDAFEINAYSAVGTFTAAQWFAPTQQLLTDLLLPNQDIMSAIEAGMGEGTGAPNLTLTLQIAALAKAAAPSIPIVVSHAVGPGGASFGVSWLKDTAADIIAFNFFGSTFGGLDDIQNLMDELKLADQTSGSKALMIFSYANIGTYNVKANFQANFLQSWYGHPDVVGMVSWGGFGPSPDGDFTLYTPPPLPFDPASVWADTAASLVYTGFGSANRNWPGALSVTGSPTITNTKAQVPLTIVTTSPTTPTVASINLATHIKVICNLSLTGTVTLTGNTGSQTTLTFDAYDGTTHFSIGTPLVISGAGSGTINATGVLPHAGDWTFTLQGQRTSGSTNATVSSATLNLGVGSKP